MGRIDRIINELEALHREAHEIFDARVDLILSRAPYDTSFGATKMNCILAPAGSALNYVQALKNLRDGKTAK